MEMHTCGSYGAMTHERNDGEGFDVYFLYNVSETSTGYVWDRKVYKRWSTAAKKIEAYFKMQGVM